MSFESPAQAASADLARTNANLGGALSAIALPELRSVIGTIGSELGKGGEPASVATAYGAARRDLNTGYDSASRNTLGLLQQQAKQSGGRYLGGQVNATYGQYAQTLEEDRSQALRRLQFGEANAGLQQYNTLLNLLGQGSGAALNLGKGYLGNQAGAIQGLSQTSQGGAALSGAAGGAALGTQIYPGWGTAIGAGVGALGGLLSAG